MTDNEFTLVKMLLKATPENLKKWYTRASDRDIEHAVDLLDRYSYHVQDLLISEQIELELANMPAMLEAQAVISALR